jgi:hypothetical protein
MGNDQPCYLRAVTVRICTTIAARNQVGSRQHFLSEIWVLCVYSGVNYADHNTVAIRY